MFELLFGGIGNNENTDENYSGMLNPHGELPLAPVKEFCEGFQYLLDEANKVSSKVSPYCNAIAIPENRALVRAGMLPTLSKEQAIKLLEEEREYQKPENRASYPFFKWF